MRPMKTRWLALVLGATASALALSAAACGSTVVHVQATSEGGTVDDPETGVSEAATMTCTPGASSDCACPTAGVTGKSLCDSTGKPGACVCPTPITDHQVISLSNLSALEAETHLSMAPDGTLVSVWISIGGGGGSDIGYTFSTDSGTTWTPVKVVGDSTGRESSDPVSAVDAQGNFYVTWIAFVRDNMGNASDFVLYVSKAMAGSKVFSTPVAVDKFASGDKPWITVTAAGTILVTCMQASGQNSVLNAHRSTNGGTTWSKTPIFTSINGNQANFIVPCAPKTGTRVWASHLSVEADLQQVLHWSDDDGVTWPVANQKVFGVNSSITPATCVAKGSDLWLAYGQWTAQPASADAPVDEYHVIHTTNGTTITDVLASDTKTKQQELGSLSLDDATGELALSYYAGDAEGTTGNVRSVRSTDNGKTWSASKVVTADLQFTANRASQKWLGDYFGSVLRGGTLFLSYGENADTATHVAFSKTQ
jgi:hypothetical protein